MCKHLFNIQHQYTQVQSLHRSLKEDEAILHIDYAENWQCTYSKEVQQVHFGASHRQTTLHNAVLYTIENTLTFCALSPSIKHDPAAIWAELEPVLQFLKLDSVSSLRHQRRPCWQMVRGHVWKWSISWDYWRCGWRWDISFFHL